MPITRSLEDWNLEFVSKLGFRVSDLVYILLTSYNEKTNEALSVNQALQGNVTMSFIGFGSLFVAQHSEGLDQLGSCLLGLDDTMYQHIGCGMIGI